MELEVLRKDMIAAMKAKRQGTQGFDFLTDRGSQKVAIDEGCRDNIPSDMVDRVILKEMKTVKEQIDTCPDSGRT